MSFLCCRWPGALILILVSLSLVLNQAVAVIVNRTIDDTFGDSETRQLPVFLPTTAGVWKNQACSDCAIRPSISSAFDHTYTSATYNPGLGSVNVTMDFNGTAIYIFFILANNAGNGITSITNCTFKLDGQQVGTFQHSPDLTTTDIEYNVLVFSKTDIPFGQHRFVIATENINFNAYVNFDYAIYTHDDDPVSTTTTLSSPTQTHSAARRPSTTDQAVHNPPSPTPAGHIAGAVVGGLIGGLACLAIIAIAVWFYVIHRPKSRSNKDVFLGSDDNLPGMMGRREILPTTNPNRDLPPLPPPVAQSDTIGTFTSTRIPTGTSIPGQTPPTRSQSLIIPPSGPNGRTATTELNHHPSLPTHAHEPSISRSNAHLHVTNPDPKARERARSIRQAELNQRLMTMKGEINELQADLNWMSVAPPGGETAETPPEVQPHAASSPISPKKNRQTGTVAQLKEQIRILTEQVAELQSQQFSPWALGLSNESPPGYTPTMANSNFTFVPDRKADS